MFEYYEGGIVCTQPYVVQYGIADLKEPTLTSHDFSGGNTVLPFEDLPITWTGSENAVYTLTLLRGSGSSQTTMWQQENIETNSITIPKEKLIPKDLDYTIRIKAVSVATGETLSAVSGTFRIDKTGFEMQTPVVTAPTAIEGLEYTGASQRLVQPGSTTGGELQYAVETSWGSTPDPWSTEIPEATDEGTWYVFYRVVGDEMYYNVPQNYVAVKIEPRSIADATVTLENAELPYTGREQTFTVASVLLGDTVLTEGVDYDVWLNKRKTAGTYELWVDGKGHYGGRATAEFTIRGLDIVATVQSVTVTYDGGEHGIDVAVTEPANATVLYMNEEGKYQLGTCPKIRDVGTLEVGYQISANNYNTITGTATVTILKNDAMVLEKPKALANLTEKGFSQDLIEKGTPMTGCRMEYALGNNPDTAPESGWSIDIPKGTDTGIYYVWYKATGYPNYNDSAAGYVTATIQPKEQQGTGTQEQGQEQQGTRTQEQGQEQQGTGTQEQGQEQQGTGTQEQGQEQQGTGTQEQNPEGTESGNTESGQPSAKGWVKTENGWEYIKEDGTKAVDWLLIDGEYYCFNENGVMRTGWYEENGFTYYLKESGKMATGDVEIDGKIYRFNEGGAYTGETSASTEPKGTEPGNAEPADPEVRGWVHTDAGWVFVMNDGRKATGWLAYGNDWYYMNVDGIMQTGWISDGGIWYYMKDSGAMAIGWINDGGTWYYMKSSGAMATGWINDGGTWYYMKPSGAMATGWISDGGTWYYMRSSGAMATGWQLDGWTWYYFDGNGAMATGWRSIGGSWYYFRNSGAMATGWFEDQEAEAKLPADQKRAIWYWFDDNGAMATGWKEIDGRWEMFADNGEWLYSWDEEGGNG